MFLQAKENNISDFELSGIKGQLLDNVSFYLAKVKNESATKQLKRHSLDQIKNSLKALGYYEPQIKLSFEQDGDVQDKQVIMKVDIDLGTEIRISQLNYHLQGEGKNDNELTQIIKKLPLVQGDVINHAHYEKSKSIIESQLLELGYFDAQWQTNELGISLKEHSAIVTFEIDTGVRYTYGPIVISSDTPAAKYIRSLASFKTGEAYQANIISQYNLDIASTPYFKSVRVYADIEHRENKQIPIKVDVLHKPANSYEIGGGFSTDLGAKARIKWSKPWVGTDGHYFDTDAVVTELEKEFEFAYTVPVDDPVDDVWRYAFGYKSENNSDTQKYIKTLTTQLQRQWVTESDWVRTVFIKHEREDYEISADEDSTEIAADKAATEIISNKDTTEMLLPGMSFAKKKSKGGTTPFWGNQWLFSAEVGLDDVLSDTDLLKLQFQTAMLRTYQNNHLFYAKASLGAILVEDINQVPASMRFFAGGDQSIRGFKYESISPEENGVLLGGKYLATGTLEYNYQFAPSWRAALFVDGGTSTNDFSEDIEVGTGIGIRWLTPIGPIRIDHAWAITDNNNTRFSVTIGPEI
jgi:translocation and assembly module TamA